jgi:hypothetical protein
MECLLKRIQLWASDLLKEHRLDEINSGCVLVDGKRVKIAYGDYSYDDGVPEQALALARKMKEIDKVLMLVVNVQFEH